MSINVKRISLENHDINIDMLYGILKDINLWSDSKPINQEGYNRKVVLRNGRLFTILEEASQ